MLPRKDLRILKIELWGIKRKWVPVLSYRNRRQSHILVSDTMWVVRAFSCGAGKRVSNAARLWAVIAWTETSSNGGYADPSPSPHVTDRS